MKSSGKLSERLGPFPDPRTRIAYEAESLEDWELLAVLLGRGNRAQPIEELSRNILHQSKGLGGLLQKQVSDLRRIPGIGNAKATALIAAIEFARRLKWEALKGKRYSSKQLLNFLSTSLIPKNRECFVLITLSPEGSVLRAEVVATGSLEEVGVQSRDLLKIILNDAASAVIIAHNHPESGCKPSREDVWIYKNFGKLLDSLGIDLLDQWIFGIDGIYSCKEGKVLQA
ncbi:DNA repair protein [Leptospira yasudae]|uniref:JAB domain-containing protein n=1 Tax=Leptospira yasudae TaxID=2202201 RepID=UPI000E59EB8B|nr:JAB domain-containing protein [Leptospira yasudae]MBW0432199.1 DNA repair protein [Leptospira yasudae]RHX95615.1 DNA repair protein [Leptospira yasudae]TGK27145.1 DNA repair protein [Leptospira yasudae]TGM08062.1 DNA repair protein [Leptospira yasudae]TGN02531.1 DNA repair protein [Leptospira yasudae]